MTGLYGVKIKSLTVNCNGTASCVGIKNASAGQGSTVEDVTIEQPNQSLIYRSSATNKVDSDSPGTIVDAYHFTANTICDQINAAWDFALDTTRNPRVTSTPIDARGFTGTHDCGNVVPLPSDANGRLLLGNVTIARNRHGAR